MPNLVHYLLKPEVELYRKGEGGDPAEADGWNWKLHHGFNRYFQRFRDRYESTLEWSLDHRAPFLIGFGILVAGSMCLVFFIGQDFFPTVDSGQIRSHIQPPSGTRIEESEKYFALADAEIRQVIPATELDMILDNIGMPASGINLAFGDNPVIGNSDGDRLHDLFRSRQHHQSNSQLRLAGAHGFAGGRARCRGKLQDRSESYEEGGGHPWRGGRSHSSDCGLPASAGSC
jgi:multidrug efflux pump subunit AcrB